VRQGTPCLSGDWVCRIFLAATCGDHRVRGIRPELARDCGWCLVSPVSVLVCKTSSATLYSGIILLISGRSRKATGSRVGASRATCRAFGWSTRIETFEPYRTLLSPTPILVSRTVTNFTRGNTVGRLIVKGGCWHYGTDTPVGSEAILRGSLKHKPLVAGKPRAECAVRELWCKIALEFEIRAFLRV